MIQLQEKLITNAWTKDDWDIYVNTINNLLLIHDKNYVSLPSKNDGDL
jgi:hypothetical protein